MPVSKRRNGSWLVSFYREDGSRFRKTLPEELTKRECETLEARYRLQERAAPDRERRAVTVSDLFARYWHEHGQHIASSATEKGYLDAWSNRLGDGTPLGSVGSDQISAAVAHWRSVPEVPKGRKVEILVRASTINHRLSCLQRVWNRAADVWNWTMPPVKWKRLRLHEPARAPRANDYELLLAYFEALPPRSRWPSLMAFHTGLRRGGVLRITRADLDYENLVIHTISKGRAGGKPTPVPMTQGVLAVLMAMGRLPEVGQIFTVTIHELRKDRQRTRKRAEVGLTRLRFHDHRHDFAQGLADRGLAGAIPDALHHSDPRVSRIYGKTGTAALRKLIDGR